MKPMSCRRLTLLALSLSMAPAATASDEGAAGGDKAGESWCGTTSPAQLAASRAEAIRRGEIADPLARTPPYAAPVPSKVREFPGGQACLTRAHIHLFEDRERLLVAPHSLPQLEALMTEAANELLAEHGERYDFIGFWTNFAAATTFGRAFYDPLFNDVSGIGDPSREGSPLFDDRLEIGLASRRVEGFVMMYDVNSWRWGPYGSDGGFTRLALSHEQEHRWAMYLPPLADGLLLQGDSLCSRVSHWNQNVDGQGSAMEITEWVGSQPAQAAQAFLSFNTDIGGVFSYPDLYLMGYVSPAEMDAGMREFRYMLNPSCSFLHHGGIRILSSADVVATSGARVPDWLHAPRHFRTAWIMIHQPGAPPATSELERAIEILTQNQRDWYDGTLGRGTMNHQLFDDCDCNRRADAGEIASGASRDTNGNGLPDHCELDCGTPDCDDDGIADSGDNCILLFNPEQPDGDADGVGDACDNCPALPNGPQQDGDGDGIGNACDTCPVAANPQQQPAVLGRELRAASRERFCWEVQTDVVWASGDLAQVGAYAVDPPQRLAGTHCNEDRRLPAAGEGFFYLVRPDCPSASWQSALGEEPGRDLALP